MANLTKTQVKARAKEIKRRLNIIKEMAENLATDIQDEIDEIEPYGDNDDLTDAQQERQEWLESQKDSLEYTESDFDSIAEQLDEIVDSD